MRRACTVLLVLAAASSALGGEPPAPGAGDSISAAKRDFDTLKAAKDADGLPKAEMPRVATPEFNLNLTPAEPRSRKAGKASELEKAKKSANWLVDAMEKKPEIERLGSRRNRAANEAGDREHDLLASERDPTLGAAERTDLKRDEDLKVERRAETAPPPNPLAGYMAGWMTPQDYVLLQPTLGASGVPKTGSAPGGQAVAPLPGMGSEAAAMSGFELGSGMFGGTRQAVAAAPRENPFLQAMTSPVQSQLSLLPPPPVAAPAGAPGPTTFLGPQPESAPVPEKSKIPDFAKPAIDNKYFKPLKRF